MSTRCNFNREEIDQLFAILAKHLAVRELRTERGGVRHAEASEFMLMHEQQTAEGRAIGFKHHWTRNYVYILDPGACGTSLYVPETIEPFNRGFFDEPPKL